AGTTGLAHRMLGDGLEASRRTVRHPWRRYRSRVSASRERDRAILLRIPQLEDGERLDAQWLPAGREREDVEVARQLRQDPGAAAGLAGICLARRSAAIQHASFALSAAYRLDARHARRCAQDIVELVWRAAKRRAGFKRARANS